jgi:hypothetical protein
MRWYERGVWWLWGFEEGLGKSESFGIVCMVWSEPGGWWDSGEKRLLTSFVFFEFVDIRQALTTQKARCLSPSWRSRGGGDLDAKVQGGSVQYEIIPTVEISS